MSKVIVTGAAGFIGANIVQGLNARGVTDIIAVDNLSRGDKFRNLADLSISDYVDAADFYTRFSAGHYGKVEAVFHEGACSDTMEKNGQYMMRNNYSVSCDLLDACQRQGTRLLYASSAATYGGTDGFKETAECEMPLNVYAYSKLLFDQKLRREFGDRYQQAKTQVVGFRYFNVYGPREQHKERMASVAYHHYLQFKKDRKVRLFGEYGGCAPGQHLRDFVYVSDVVAINLWFFDHPTKSGLFNLGTGKAQPFNDVAVAVIGHLEPGNQPVRDAAALASAGLIEYIEFPDVLRGKYQCYSQADLSALRDAGCDHRFADVAAGVSRYMQWLQSQPDQG